MKDIRKGNDIFITWVIRNVPSSDDLSVVLYGPGNKVCTLTNGSGTYNATAQSYVYTATYQGIDQSSIGIYRMELHRNYGEADQNVLDKVHAFRLWGPVEWGIMRGNDPDNLTTAVVNLESSYSATTNAGLDPADYYTRGEVDALLDGKEDTLDYYSEDTTHGSAKIDVGFGSVEVSEADAGTVNIEAAHTLIQDEAGNSVLVGSAGGVGVNVQTADGETLKYNGHEVATKDEIPEAITVDDALSNTSENPVQNKVVTTALNGKQPTIDDLSTIRSGAAAGATAYQKPSGGIPATDLAPAVQTSLGKADTAVQEAPEDHKQYAREDGQWVEVQASGGGGLTIVEVASGTSAITAEVDKYYKVAGDVTTLAITLPTIASTETSVKEVAFSFTTGNNPNVTFGTADANAQIKYYDGFLIASFNAYEVKCVYNGTKWIVSEIKQSGGAGPVGSGELVTVSVNKIDGQNTTTITTGVDIIVVVENQTYFYTTDNTGSVSFTIPYGSSYSITAGRYVGLYIANNNYTRSFTASSYTREVIYNYRTASLGLYVTDADGNDYTLSEWEELVAAGTKTNDQALYIHVVEGNLIANGGTFLVGIDMLRNRSYTSQQWANANVVFNSIPTNCQNATSAHYYDGLTLTSLAYNEGVTRNYTTPAITKCYGTEASPEGVTVGGTFCRGFLGSYGQWYILWSNASLVDEILVSTRPNGTYTFSSLTTQKWTSAQCYVNNGYQIAYVGSSMNVYNIKTTVYITIPFYSF